MPARPRHGRRDAFMSKNADESPLSDEAADAAYQEALRLASGEGARAHAARVLSLLTAAANRGHALAQYALATWYYFGVHARKNYRKAFDLVTKAARKNVPDAVFNLANSYEMGR